MPYIKSAENRRRLNSIEKDLLFLLDSIGIEGNLNYFLFKLAKDYCTRYKDFKNFEGECQQALREIYRRLEAPYEDEKIKENGDVI